MYLSKENRQTIFGKKVEIWRKQKEESAYVCYV